MDYDLFRPVAESRLVESPGSFEDFIASDRSVTIVENLEPLSQAQLHLAYPCLFHFEDRELLSSVPREVALDLIQADAAWRCLTPRQAATLRLYNSRDYDLLEFLLAEGILEDRRGIRSKQLLSAIYRRSNTAEALINELECELPAVSQLRDLLNRPITARVACYLVEFRYALPIWPRPELVAFNVRPDDLEFMMQDDFGGDYYGGQISHSDHDDFVDTSYFHFWGPTSSGSFFDEEWLVPNSYPPAFADYAGCDQPVYQVDTEPPKKSNPAVGPLLLALFCCPCAGSGRAQKPTPASTD